MTEGSVSLSPEKTRVEAPARERRASATRAIDRPGLALAAIVVAAAALRFVFLGHQGYWLDEGITLSVLHKSFWASMSALPHRESTPPLYYAIAWAWARVFGFGEFGVRSLSAVMGVAAVPVAYALGRRVASTRAGLIAAALTASSSLLVWYSQEARPYSMLVALSALTLLAFEQARVQPTPRRFGLWAISAALAMLAHYFAAAVVVPEACWLLWTHRRTVSAWVGVGAAGAVGVALIPLAHKQSKFTLWIAQAPLKVRLHQLGEQFVVGFALPRYTIIFLVAVATAIVAVVVLIRRGQREHKLGALRMGGIVVTGFVLIMIVEAAGSQLANTRNLLELWVPLAVVVAVGLATPAFGRLGLLAAAGLCAVGIAGTVYIDARPWLQRPDWRPVTKAIGAPLAPGTPGARVVLLLRYGSPYPVSLYKPYLVRMSSRKPERIRELDIITANQAHYVFHCWWGALCGLHRMHFNKPPELAGFTDVGAVTRGPFVLTRLKASTPVRLRPNQILRVLPGYSTHPHIFLLEKQQVPAP